MPFCRECGKEVKNDWATCPFCSASLQIDTPPQSNQYKKPQGSPSSDWKSVSHNGQLIELVPSENWEYYWADDEWHSVNQPIQSPIQTVSASKVPPSNSKEMSSNTMVLPSSFHSIREASTISPSARNTIHEMFGDDDDEEDDKKPRSITAEVLKLILFDTPISYFAVYMMKSGDPMMGIFILLGIPLIHIGPNASKKVKVASVIVLTIIVTVALGGILSVWADELAQGAADEGTFVWEVTVLDNSDDIDDLVYIQMVDGNSLNWDDLGVMIYINDGTPMRCTADNSTNACSYDYYYQNSSGNDVEWETGEGIVITEGDAGGCDGNGNCNVRVILSNGQNKEIGNFAVTVN